MADGTTDIPGSRGLGAAERHVRRQMLDRLQRIALGAVSRRHTAESYRSEPAHLESKDSGPDWHPSAHYCHANVEMWVHYYPRHKRVRGFVLHGPQLGIWLVIAHSLVEIEDGSLVDITPHGVSQMYPFVRHVGTDEEFDEFATEGQIGVCHPRDEGE
jgi:hypothetical protein